MKEGAFERTIGEPHALFAGIYRPGRLVHKKTQLDSVALSATQVAKGSYNLSIRGLPRGEVVKHVELRRRRRRRRRSGARATCDAVQTNHEARAAAE